MANGSRERLLALNKAGLRVFLALLVFFPSPTFADLRPELLPLPEGLRPKVEFWEKVFYRYPSDQVLIHDSDGNLALVDIIDFQVWAKKQNRPLPDRRTRNKITESYLNRYELALKRFHQLGKDALSYGPIENRIYTVFSRRAEDLNRLFNKKISLRSQGGLSDEFLRAASRAERFLPYMEKVFRKKGLPHEITRLAFVESMFNTKARSKVGASGIWQFMPQTAKQYLTINHLIDERNSPFKASEAAAELLSENYRELGNWPLAITAYNHGKAGMLRAVRNAKTFDLAKIIETYDGPNFQFASRNFYAEFLAAHRIYERLHTEQKLFPVFDKDPIRAITLNQPLSIAELLHRYDIDKALLHHYNEGLNHRVFSDYRYHKLPKKTRLFLPNSVAKKIESKLKSKKEFYAHND